MWHLSFAWPFPVQQVERSCASHLICGKWETQPEVNNMHFGEDGGKIRGERKEMGIIDQGGEQKKISLASSALP